MSASTGRRTALDAIGAGIDPPDPRAFEHEQRVEIGLVLDDAHRFARLQNADDRLARRRAGHPRRGQQRGDQRAGHQRPPKLLEHEGRLGDPELEATVGLGQGQREHAGVAELAPSLAVEVTGGFDPAYRVEGEPPVEEAAHPLLERLLIGRELEVHQRSFGSPRTRSPTMLRLTCDVPAAMVIDSA